jgi:hypothetical protein
VKERIAIPSNGKNEEWEKLMEAAPDNLKEEFDKDKGPLVFIKREGAATGAWIHRERTKLWEKADGEELAVECLALWLRYQGPLPLSRIQEVFAFSQTQAEEAARALAESGELVRDVSVEGLPACLVCDRDNLEMLLRLSRRKRRPDLKERPLRFLIPYLAQRQGILARDGEGRPWETLVGFPAPVKLWETEFFPVRSDAYRGDLLDREIKEARLLWYGSGKEKAGFCEPADLDMVLNQAAETPQPFAGGESPLPPEFFDTLRGFWEIKDALGGDNSSCAEALWQQVWKGRSFPGPPCSRPCAAWNLPENLQRAASFQESIHYSSPPLRSPENWKKRKPKKVSFG